MKIDELFDFVSTDKAVHLQRELSSRISCSDNDDFNPRLLRGLDAAYDGDTAYIAVAIWDSKRREFVRKAHAIEKVKLGYVSGFLGFREGPLLVEIARTLEPEPDVVLVDGQGIAHPRRFGVACHVGLALDKPTIGVAKTRLYGRCEGKKIIAPNGDLIGRVLALRDRKKFYVSVGHRISLNTACTLVDSCIEAGHPVPLRQAHLDSIHMKRDQQA